MHNALLECYASAKQPRSGSDAPLFYPSSGPDAVLIQESDFEPWSEDCILPRDQYDSYKACLVNTPAPVRPREPEFSDDALNEAGYVSWCAYSVAQGMWNW
jgi:hypothetical protein